MEFEQLGLFDEEYPQYKIEKPIRLIELFAGVGSQSMALKRLGVDFESYKAVEFDEFAIRSYNSIHNTDFPTLDITKTHAADLEIVDRDKYEYIMFYSFPCTDLSLAGQQAGMSRESGTRSGLSRKCLSLSGNKSNIESKRLQGSSIDSCKRIKSQRGVDLCYIGTRLVDVSACICVRYDAGICRHKMEHTGVLVEYE